MKYTTDMLQQLVAILTQKGIYPKEKQLCTDVKAAIESQEEIESIESFVDSFLVGRQEKKKAIAPQKTTSGFAPNIQKGKAKKAGAIFLLHGESGTGKTWLTASRPRTLVGDAEKGSLLIDCARDIIKDWQYLNNLVDWFFSAENTDFDTLTLDSVTQLEKMCWDFVCQQNGWATLEKPGYGKGYIAANGEFAKMVMKARNASLETGKSLIFVGHSKVRTVPNSEGEDFEKTCLNLHKDLHEFLYGQCDFVLYSHWKKTLVNVDPNDRDSKVIAQGAKILQLHTGGSPNITSKNRCYPSLPSIIQVPPINASEDVINKFWEQFK